MPKATCSIEGCESTVQVRKGLCAKHYSRVRSHGDPSVTLRRPPGELRAWLIDLAHSCDIDDCVFVGSSYRKADGIGAHVLVCLEAHGAKPPDKDVVAHTCGNGHHGCVNPRHLYWATWAENNGRDKIAHGTIMRGEQNPRTTLTADGVRTIRALREAGETYPAIAARFGITKQSAFQICKRQSWAWLGQNPSDGIDAIAEMTS